jgi:ADP-ribosylation factor-like protein 6
MLLHLHKPSPTPHIPTNQLLPSYQIFLLVSIAISLAVNFYNHQPMGNKEGKLLLVGLDNSGKTTILSRLINPDKLDTDITPTIGFNRSTFTRQSINFEVLDMSGDSKYRDLWQTNAEYSCNIIDGIVFVIDASDKLRINVARSELELLLENKEIPYTIPYLFYANKCDLQSSCNPTEIATIMQLESIKR